MTGTLPLRCCSAPRVVVAGHWHGTKSGSGGDGWYRRWWQEQPVSKRGEQRPSPIPCTPPNPAFATGRVGSEPGSRASKFLPQPGSWISRAWRTPLPKVLCRASRGQALPCGLQMPNSQMNLRWPESALKIDPEIQDWGERKGQA